MRGHLAWPFFDDAHRAFASGLDAWAAENAAGVEHDDADTAVRTLVRAMGDAGWLRYCVPAAQGGALPQLDARALCIARETLAYHEPLADFGFAMQGLGSGPITLGGNAGQQARYLPDVVAGTSVAAFALSESGAGSDAAALQTRAIPDGDGYLLHGEKMWISNGGIADFYVVFARTSEEHGSKGVSAFVVDAATPGVVVDRRLETIAPHPLARLLFTGARVPASQRLGEPGTGFRLAMQTLDVFRTSVAAAAVGFARRALDAAVAHAAQRHMFGKRLIDQQLTHAAIADMVTDTDAAALLTYRAAWTRDTTAARPTGPAAMAKLAATEGAQRTIDRAVQLFGALGVERGNVAERLYREIRALRIYEGASEVQKLVIARERIAEHTATAGGQNG